MTEEPFTDHVRRLRSDGLTYKDMALRSSGARSSAWWHGLVTGKPSQPPEPEVIPDIAKLFDLPEETVSEMIALQWYSVRPSRGHSDMADKVAHFYDQLPEMDQQAVRAVVSAFYSHVVEKQAQELQRRYEAGEDLLAP
ncbi:helix-turn-helix domain-containing protein [Microbispora sp. RL4-1S]|uniref:Helix-turn-helix domain-containing protein n=1 Tax=Microbispora oryzae TaxID=2806554 RepID=A0A940WR49_9ACTN|nr:helix-turn-helix domain-containing protein [Microbispora oryzae]MBP2707763.1 helix-turn-helix domain-containing protein [Microbispora oryzae]